MTVHAVITKGYNEDGKLVAYEAGATFTDFSELDFGNSVGGWKCYHVALPGNEPDGVIFAIDDTSVCEFVQEKLTEDGYEDCEIYERILTWRGVKGSLGQR